jgi:hypothetical protein
MCFSDAALGLMQMTVFQGPMVEEEHQSFAPWLSQVFPSTILEAFLKVSEMKQEELLTNC